jgi:hypothetical protein
MQVDTFINKYKGITSEKQHDQDFVRDFASLFLDAGDDAFHWQYPVRLPSGTMGSIDALRPGEILVEMKSGGKVAKPAAERNLRRVLEDQVKSKYIRGLSGADQPKLRIVSDYQHFLVEDERGNTHFFRLDKLDDYLHLFRPMFDKVQEHLERHGGVNARAATLLANVIRHLDAQEYSEIANYAARLMFLLYADDNLIWTQDEFLDKIARTDADHLGYEINSIFNHLNDPAAGSPDAPFEYINGGLFADRLPLAKYTDEMRDALLEACAYDWRGLDPMIFGTVYQSAMDKAKRDEDGAHYTHEEDILGLLGPVLLDDLRERMESAWHSIGRLDAFLGHLSSVKVLDPAAGSGNFLMVAYREMRRIELQVILRMRELVGGDARQPGVMLNQFHGIEYEALSAYLAKAGLWLTMHAQDVRYTAETMCDVKTFPIHQYPDVRTASAAALDWSKEFPGLTAIVGNPPYLSADRMTEDQRAERDSFGISGGKMDYAHIWMVSGARYIAQYPDTLVGYVITDSIGQGTQAAGLWKHEAMQNVYVRYGHQSRVWPGDAQVRVVDVVLGSKPEALGLRDESGVAVEAAYITPYITRASVPTREIAGAVSAPPVWFPRWKAGKAYLDGGVYSKLSDSDLAQIRQDHPEMLIRKVSAVNTLNEREDWILWWENATPEARRHPVIKRLRAAGTEARNSLKSAAGIPEFERPEWFPSGHTRTGQMMVIPRTLSKEYITTPVVVLDGLHYITDGSYAAALDWFAAGIVMSRRANDLQRVAGGKIGKGGDIRYNTGLLYGMLHTQPAANDTPEMRERIAAKAQECVEGREGTASETMKRSNVSPKLARLHAELDALVDEWWG